ncbi:MAG TPA: nucleotidyltransferase family protein [Stellaceae bacterium]|nr:nucleotidyltransferase family protein [Stellaceae bacterium]
MPGRAGNLILLASCLGDNDETRTLLAKTLASADWEAVLPIADRHLLLPTLWKSLCRKGLETELAPSPRDFLKEIYGLNASRNSRLKRQAIEIVDALSHAGIASVLLKGAAFLFESAPEDLGDRMMLDLDVLVPEHDLAQSITILKSLGYETIGDQKLAHHHPPLFRQGEVATVEVHWHVWEEATLLPTEHVFGDARMLEADAARVWIPSPNHRIIHNLVHAAVQDGEFVGGVISLKALYDLIRISQAHQASIDWEEIGSLMRSCGFGRELEAHVYMAERLFGWRRPSCITPTWRAALHYQRCLMFSSLRGAALPTFNSITTPSQRESLRNFIIGVMTPEQRKLIKRLADWR